MNRSQLISEAWSMLRRNRILWQTALLIAAVKVLFTLLTTVSSDVVALARLATVFAFTALITTALISLVNAIADGQSPTARGSFRLGVERLLPQSIVAVIFAAPNWIVLSIATGSISSVWSNFNLPGNRGLTEVMNFFGPLLGAFGVMFVVGVFTEAIGVGAERAIVFDNAGVVTALKRGWHFLSKHVSDYVVINLLLLVVALGIGLLYACPSIFLRNALVPADMQLGTYVSPTLALTRPAIIVYFFLKELVDAVVFVLSSAVWTLAYRQWLKSEPALHTESAVISI